MDRKKQATLVQHGKLRMIPISVKKLAPILDIVRGKEVYTALDILRLLPKKGAKYTAKLLKSVVANVENNRKVSAKGMHIIEIYATKATGLKRYRPGARLRVKPYVKYRSNIFIKIGHVS